MNILIATGSSGGHIYPALAFGDYFECRHPDAKILYIAGLRAKEKGFFSRVNPERVLYFRERGFSFFGIISCVCNLIKNYLRSYQIITREKPDVIIGFGSNVSLPVVFAGRCLAYPCVIHEQNVRFGKANMLLRLIGCRTALSFSPPRKSANDRVTGNIIRHTFVEEAERTGAEKKKGGPFRLLALGGSQGSRFINDLVLAYAGNRTDEEKESFAVTLITGHEDYERVSRTVETRGLQIALFSFTDEMPLLYKEADILLARAGAGVIAETLIFCLPAVYIPYPYAGQHQKANAYYAEAAGAAKVIIQNADALRTFTGWMQQIRQEPEQLLRMAESAKKIRIMDSCERFTGIIEDLMEERGKNG